MSDDLSWKISPDTLERSALDAWLRSLQVLDTVEHEDGRRAHVAELSSRSAKVFLLSGGLDVWDLKDLRPILFQKLAPREREYLQISSSCSRRVLSVVEISHRDDAWSSGLESSLVQIFSEPDDPCVATRTKTPLRVGDVLPSEVS